MQAELYSWGAAQEVTGSKHFIRFQDKTIMIDCGAFQGRRAESDKKNRDWPFDATKVDALVLTHAHFDHCGLLPLMVKNGYTNNFYSTHATRDLASLVLMDSAHIQARDIEFLQKRNRKKGKELTKEPLYTEEDVQKCLDNFVTISYHRPIYLTNNIKATLYDAGHILGSALAVIELEENSKKITIGFTGDLGRKNLPILRDPEKIPPVDYLVTESTYGNRLHDSIDMVMDELAEVINKTAKRGGKIIVPSFAIGRTQELIYFTHLLNDQKRIPKIPVYVDSPMATNATSIFRVHQECYDQETNDAFIAHHKNPFGFNELRYTTNVQESKRINTMDTPAIIISSSGMCEGGRVLHHLRNSIENPRNTILAVGYMAQNTLGRRIVEKHPRIKIFGDSFNLKAEVKVINSLSAHADYNDITDYVSQVNSNNTLKKVFLVHGEQTAQDNLQNILQSKGYNTDIVKLNEKYVLK